MSPIALTALVPLSLALEDAPAQKALALMAADRSFAWALAANVLLAYFINLTNFLVTRYTSALTLQVSARLMLSSALPHLRFLHPATPLQACPYPDTPHATRLTILYCLEHPAGHPL